MDRLEEAIQELRVSRGWDKTDTNGRLAKSVVVEASELLECFQWDDVNVNLDNVKGEVADVLLNLVAMCIDNGWDYQQVVIDKIVEIKKKYPEVK